MRYVLIVLYALTCSGCAAIAAYQNRDASENEVQLHTEGQGDQLAKGPHKFSVVAFTANRRAMAVSTNTAAHPNSVVFCAEPPPDAVSSLLASDGANVGLTNASSEEAKIAVSSTYATAAASIAARNPLVEVYRTSVYSICQLYANKAITEREAYTLFSEITLKVVGQMDGKASFVEPKVPGAIPHTPCAAGQLNCRPQTVPSEDKPEIKQPACKPGTKAQAPKANADGTVDVGCKAPAKEPTKEPVKDPAAAPTPTPPVAPKRG